MPTDGHSKLQRQLSGDLAGAGGELGEAGEDQEDGGLLLLLLGFDLGDLVLGGGEAGGRPFDFAEPSLAFGFVDPVFEVVTDLFQAGFLLQGDDQDRAADAGVFVDAVGSVGPPALAQRLLPPLEVGQELLPFLDCDSSVFLGWAEIAAAGDEGPVCFERVDRVDG
ncbi:hypothetical protein AB0B79_39425 [Streptomyces sp. NPDC039022]|uniref:hypothetical protein n=1 Tax=Streptomyces sp. NPDC039022 TaxID=3157091 RepID=UPI00340F6544